MQVISVESTELFVGPPDAPLQLARVALAGVAGPTPVRIDGDGLKGEAVADIAVLPGLLGRLDPKTGDIKLVTSPTPWPSEQPKSIGDDLISPPVLGA